MARRALILIAAALPSVAWAQAITLEVTPQGAPGGPLSAGRVSFGQVSTLAGQPRIGRRVRTEGGAHFVAPFVARVQVDSVLRPARRPAAASARVAPSQLDRTVQPTIWTPQVEILLRLAGLGHLDGSVQLGIGRGTPWHHGPGVGTELTVMDSVVGAGEGRFEVVHEISVWMPDTAWGPQQETLMYTAVPR